MEPKLERLYGIVSEVDEQTVRVNMLFRNRESFVIHRCVLGDMQIHIGDGLRFIGEADSVTIRNIGSNPKQREDVEALIRGIIGIMTDINLEPIRQNLVTTA